MNAPLIETERRGLEPIQKPGRSKQDYSTPPSFLAAIAKQFGPIEFDLAARADNAVAPAFYTPEQDSLARDWALRNVGVAFCNPPFANIEPWAAKLNTCKWLPRWTLMLVPYSAASGWFVKNVMGQLMVYGIPRLQFVGTDSVYPKDLCLIGAGYGANGVGFWDWRNA